jgi:mRNA interferase YafQ
LTQRYRSEFKKEFKKALQDGHDRDEILEVMRILAEGEALGPKYKDHALKWKWVGYREYHIEPDLLLIYRLRGDEIVFTRLGTHKELFG